MSSGIDPAATDERRATAATVCAWLPRHRKAAGEARKLLRTLLADQEDGERLCEIGELIVSELVANSVRHARVPPGRLIGVELEVQHGRLRIDVHDASVEHPVMRPETDEGSESGRGLLLVNALASAWGCSAHPGLGKSVWALVGPDDGTSTGR